MSPRKSASRLAVVIAVAACLASLLLAPYSFATAQGQIPSWRQSGNEAPLDLGAAGLSQSLRRLGVVASVLHIGAHPDDEDSGLLAYLGRGRQARTAYLSLTRGDGGQNLIGPELYDRLGVIRTDELLAARRLDGAAQFFSRAYDFGFSKSREEALQRWNREEVVADIVRVIRTFRPLVVVSRFSGTPRDGHGHHQAAGVLTVEAVRAAGDPNRFTDQIAGGLRPWRVPKLYVSVSARQREGEEPPRFTVELNTGAFDPVLGRSYYEIAMEGRSQHRSQDQGAIQRRGPQYSRLLLISGEGEIPEREADIFDGFDTRLTGIARFAGEGAELLRAKLVEAQDVAELAVESFNPTNPWSLAPVLARGLRQIREARAAAEALDIQDQARFEINFLLDQKEKDFAEALARSASVVVDCISDREVATPGESISASVTILAAAPSRVVGASIEAPRGWRVSEGKQNENVVDGQRTVTREFTVDIPIDATPTRPYWLASTREGAMFRPGDGGTGIEPHLPPDVYARVELDIAGQLVIVHRPAEYRFADKALGELRREIKIAPAISLEVTPRVLISDISSESNQSVSVNLTNNSRSEVTGSIRLEAPPGWVVEPPEISFNLSRFGERTGHNFRVEVPSGAAKGTYELRAVAEAGGRLYDTGYREVSYPHTQSRLVYSPATGIVQVFDIKVARDLKVGFIEGAGDGFVDALMRMGVDVAIIDARELASGDLSRYEVIVTGVRVYEVRPDVVSHNGRLLDYVRNGGTLIVQYNKIEFAQGNFAPYPVRMNQPIDRVTDHQAEVTILDPDHPLFNAPNRISREDFEGWVHERGAYFLRTWDSRFKPLMSCKDPGEEPKEGGHLIAEYGSGVYIYTGYSWFRQLPEGVPGAYRLAANLVSLPRNRNAR